MIQCAIVLSKIQPATYKQWEIACWKDLEQRGHTSVLSVDMDTALNNLLDGGLINNTKGKFKLKYSLKDTIKRIKDECAKQRKEEDRYNKERKEELIKWINTVSHTEMRDTLIKIANIDEYNCHGMFWEELQWLLEYVE